MADAKTAPLTLVDPVAEANCPHCGQVCDVSDLAPFTPMECPHCGRRSVVPARLGSFLLLDVIGSGGMGSVYVARDETLGRLVAIKVLLPTLGADPQFVETFKREAQAAAQLNHPHVAQIHSFGEVKGQPYIVMEFVAGRHLDAMIAHESPLDPRLVMGVGVDIAEGLQAANDVGLVHGDIKPENILFDEKGNAKLVDFGIAATINERSDGGIWGTPYYVAPEKVRRQKTDARSDIYCLGGTLFHALAGRPAFDGATPLDVVKARLETPAPRLRTIRPDIDERVESVVARMLEADPFHRYPTYPSLLSDMRKTLDALPKSEGAPSAARARSGRRIVIRKRADGDSTSRSSQFASVSPDQKTAGGNTASPAEDAEALAARRARRKRNVRRTLAVLLTLAALGGIAVGVYVVRERKDLQIAGRREFFALKKTREDAETTFAAIQATHSNLLAVLSTTTNWADRVCRAVESVTGQPTDALRALSVPKPKPPPEPEPQPPPTNSVPAGQPAPPETPDKLATNTAPATVPPASNIVPEATAPEPQPPATEPDPAEDTAPVAEPGESEPASPEPVAEEPAPAPAEEHPILEPARAVMLALARLREMETESGAQVNTATELRTRAAAAERSADASPLLEPLAAAQAAVAELARSAESLIADTGRSLARVETLHGDAERQRAEQARAAAEAERLRIQEKERQEQEAQRQVAVAEELATVLALRAENAVALKQHSFEALARDTARRVADMKTLEGKAAMQTLTDRYTRLVALRDFLVERIAKAPFKWGWIQGVAPEDILGATPRHIELRGRRVPWSEVSIRQMLYMIRHYLDAKDTTLTTRGQMSLAAGVYCLENGGATQAAQFAREAKQSFPHLATEVDRLIPPDPTLP